jgi:hypothetical protein
MSGSKDTGRFTFVAAVLACVIGVTAYVLSVGRGDGGAEDVPRLDLPAHAATHTTTDVGAAAMCPWRDPQADLRALFPGADGYTQATLILSPLRLPILRRLGPGATLPSNTLYAYRVTRGGEPQGAVLVRRVPGEYGAIEVVVGVDRTRRIVGVRVQRHREPDETARVLFVPAWLGAFRGKGAGDMFQPGRDLPAVPPDALTDARAVANAVRSLLVEFDVAEQAAARAAAAR